MGAALAVATAVRETGVVAAALAAAGAFLLPTPRARALSMLVALTLTPVLLLGELWDTPQFDRVRGQPVAVAAAACAGLAAVAALAFAVLRRPVVFPVLAVLALPFRLPVDAGGETANLLVPLYLVVAAGGLAYAWERVRVGPCRVAPVERDPGRLELALLLAVVLYAVQAAYSTDFQRALENVVFFYVPFALLLRLLASAAWSRRLVVACLTAPVVLAVVFVGIGFWEYSARELLWNPKVIESNQFESYFRVNSLFFDPNIYGRFLATTMIAVAAVLLWGRRRRNLLLAALILAVLWAGLVLTFSQSSFGALLVGLAGLAALRWRPRVVLAAGGAAAMVALVLVVAAPGLLRLDLGSESSIDDATSGRADLMRGGAEIFASRPFFGYGSGSFEERYRAREEGSSQEAVAASHTIPITVAAEQGVVGLLAYGLVMAAALGLLFGGCLRALRGPEPPGALLVARAAVAAAFLALAFHTLLYAAFLEDPLAWALMGAGIGLRWTVREGRSATAAPQPSSRSSSAYRLE